MTQCNVTLSNLGEAYPRSCRQCGLGPCNETTWPVLDKVDAVKPPPTTTPTPATVYMHGEELRLELRNPSKQTLLAAVDFLANLAGGAR